MTEDRSWDLPESQVTDRGAIRRRRFLKLAGGLGVLGAAGGYGFYRYRGTDEEILEAGRQQIVSNPKPLPEPQALVPVEDFAPGRPETPQAAVARYVNYYEFSPTKVGTWRKAQALPVQPWTLTVDGLVENPRTFDIDEIQNLLGAEQRVYRHRCVETWAMVVPWSGIPLEKLVKLVAPLDKAKYVRFYSAEVQRLVGLEFDSRWDWPYQEGLTIAEATNPLAFLATGYYGEKLFKQNGAPIRLVVPWKYGFKSAKSLARIEFTDKKPATFWNSAAPNEYGFFANVNPEVDHPRWSQKTEWMIDNEERYPTQLYNGYGKWVADLYTGNEV